MKVVYRFDLLIDFVGDGIGSSQLIIKLGGNLLTEERLIYQ